MAACSVSIGYRRVPASVNGDGGIAPTNHPHGEKDHVEQTRTQPSDNHPYAHFSWGRTAGWIFGSWPPTAITYQALFLRPGTGPSVGSLHRGGLSFEAPDATETPDRLT